ncbi:hypothetical protein GOBAR_AA40471 [Gossypium barbadense]|uniref:RNase H type-1 domain-containing protein n=1 Tax=Gossypium barbadense TaxID=3634 RepID=A0A2P5VN31_GOSBA|nr:hypothetical protein GOBAR_AA40471 [Gossypium barbadense]
MTFAHSNCSYVWRSLIILWLEVINSIMWSIGDGRTVSFWNDPWVKDVGPLQTHHIDRGCIDETLRVCDLITFDESWNWQQLEMLLPRSVIGCIAAVLPPSQRNMSTPVDGSKVGKSTCHKEERVKNGMVDDAHCVICGENVETTIHVVRDCKFATIVWRVVDHLMYNIILREKWYPPENRWVKLITDDTLSVKHHTVAVGGAGRDLNGGWMFSFAKRVVSNIFQIEAQAIYEGLLNAWQKGFRKVEMTMRLMVTFQNCD